MTKPDMAAKLWPSTQLLVTGDTGDPQASVLDPRAQLKFLAHLAPLVGPDTFAESLVYSTPRGNTGWTGFRMGRLGHATYHHWDVAKPNLLQFDLFAIGTVDDQRALVAVDDLWSPTGARIIVVRRMDPSVEFVENTCRDDLSKRTGGQAGLGPGDHLHLMVDQTSPAGRRPLKSPDLDQSIMKLVDLLRMRAMTPVMRHDRIENDGFAYDAIVGITTSHISLRLRQTHDRIDVCLDVFSCRKFDVESVFGWLDHLLPTPTSRRSILYNRYPKNEFSIVS